MKIHIDTATCTGHGRCYSLAPEVFDCDDDGYGRITSEAVPEALQDKALIGAQNCPEHAISVE